MAALTRAEIRRRFKVLDRAKTPQRRGRLLEDLVAWLFGAIPGVTFEGSRVRSYFRSEEIDLGFRNARSKRGLGDREHPDILVVECKSSANPVGAMDVCWFLTKLKRRSLNFGVLVAANGVTGEADELTDAHDIGAYFLHEGVRLVVLTRADLEALTGSADLVALIQRKIGSLVLGFRLTD